MRMFPIARLSHRSRFLLVRIRRRATSVELPQAVGIAALFVGTSSCIRTVGRSRNMPRSAHSRVVQMAAAFFSVAAALVVYPAPAAAQVSGATSWQNDLTPIAPTD